MLILSTVQARLGAIPRLLYRLHLLNLDVVAGALASHLMVRVLLQTPAYASVSYVMLGSAVWIIYTLDRLWDAYRMKDCPASPRHQFHYQNRKPLRWAVVTLVIPTAATSSYFLPRRVLWFGLGLALLVALYLWIVHLLAARRKNWFQKEPLVAVLYAAGIWGPVMVVKGNCSLAEWALCVIFTAIAFQNLLLFSLFDIKNDSRKQERSLAISWGSERSVQVLHWLFAAIVLACIGIGAATPEGPQREVAVIEAGMSLVLFLITCFPAWFGRNERFRWIGDGIFLLPLLVGI